LLQSLGSRYFLSIEENGEKKEEQRTEEERTGQEDRQRHSCGERSNKKNVARVLQAPFASRLKILFLR
jgi:hypothetical protein